MGSHSVEFDRRSGDGLGYSKWLDQRGCSTMAAVNRFILSWQATVVGLVWLLIFAALHLWPASYWFEARTLHIASGKPSSELEVLLDRTAHRDFHGKRIINISNWAGTEWVRVCTTSVDTTFGPKVNMPVILKLGMAHQACHPFPPGKYKALITWIIEIPGPMPDKVVSIESDVFEVFP